MAEEETRILCANLEKLFDRIIMLEVHTKNLRKKIKRNSANKGASQRNVLDSLNELSVKLEMHSNN